MRQKKDLAPVKLIGFDGDKAWYWVRVHNTVFEDILVDRTLAAAGSRTNPGVPPWRFISGDWISISYYPFNVVRFMTYTLATPDPKWFEALDDLSPEDRERSLRDKKGVLKPQ